MSLTQTPQNNGKRYTRRVRDTGYDRLMEKTAWMSVADQLDEGCGTVGTLLNVTHDAPTPLGMTVWCETELVEVDGRRLVFDVAAYDAKGKIGGGRHERFIIQNEKFQAKANKKASC